MSSGRKVVVFGPTGTAGSAVVRQCLDDPRIAEVRAITRRDLPITHAKLRAVRLADFTQLGTQREALNGMEACFYCLGISQSQAKDEAEYRRITVDYPVEAARMMKELNPRGTFHFLSGQGTNPEGTSLMMWARVKGEAENALRALGMGRLFCYRPGYIHPSSDQRKPGFVAGLARVLFPIFRVVAPATVLHSAELANAMIEAELGDEPGRVLEHREILALASRHAALTAAE